jgi:hypothetical protein
MKDLVELAKEISEQNGYDLFYYEPTNEIWISGYIGEKKFDIFIKLVEDNKIKFIFEEPDVRKVALFLSEVDAMKRLKHLIEEEKNKEKEKETEDVFEKLTGLLSYDQMMEQEKKKQNNKENK